MERIKQHNARSSAERLVARRQTSPEALLAKRQGSLSGVTGSISGGANAAGGKIADSTAGLTDAQTIGIVCGIAGLVLLIGWLLWRCAARRAKARQARKEQEDRERISASTSAQQQLAEKRLSSGEKGKKRKSGSFMLNMGNIAPSSGAAAGRRKSKHGEGAFYSAADENVSQKALLAESEQAYRSQQQYAPPVPTMPHYEQHEGDISAYSTVSTPYGKTYHNPHAAVPMPMPEPATSPTTTQGVPTQVGAESDMPVYFHLPQTPAHQPVQARPASPPPQRRGRTRTTSSGQQQEYRQYGGADVPHVPSQR